MDYENQIIASILKNFRKSPLHKNDFFQSDAEIIELDSRDYLLTMDSFSGEDHFRTDNPLILGMNLAACTISDILACGAAPVFYSNSLTKSHDWDMDYLDLLSLGISEVLEKCRAAFVGGDIGVSDKWNYTGVCIGKSERIVTRKGALPGDIIYVTGKIGMGNFEAASGLFSDIPGIRHLFDECQVKFPIRLEESKFISKFASSSIDTSDGLFKSLSIISEINNTGFVISDIPYSERGSKLTDYLDLPVEMLMFGESGEYELVFTVPAFKEKEFLSESERKGLNFYRIGLIRNDMSRLSLQNGEITDYSDFDLSARSFGNHYLYLDELKKYLKQKLLSTIHN